MVQMDLLGLQEAGQMPMAPASVPSSTGPPGCAAVGCDYTIGVGLGALEGLSVKPHLEWERHGETSTQSPDGF